MIEKYVKIWLSMLPLNEDAQKRIHRKFTIDVNYNSNHIEGNTLSYGQTELLLMFGEVSGNALMKDFEEMKAHNVGLEFISDYAKDPKRRLTEHLVRELNKVILVQDYWKNAKTIEGNNTRIKIKVGEYKTRPNSVLTATGEMFNYASPVETHAMMHDLFFWYQRESDKKSMSAIELASMFHYRFIRIHPFEDGNGRIARLLVNYILLKNNLPMLVVQSADKSNYLKALHQCDVSCGYLPVEGANATLNDIKPLTEYLKIELLNSLKICIDIVNLKNGGTINDLWWYNGGQIVLKNQTQRAILELMISDATSSIRNISAILKINKSAIQKSIDGLRNKKYIERIGGTKGVWIVNLSKEP